MERVVVQIYADSRSVSHKVSKFLLNAAMCGVVLCHRLMTISRLSNTIHHFDMRPPLGSLSEIFHYDQFIATRREERSRTILSFSYHGVCRHGAHCFGGGVCFLVHPRCYCFALCSASDRTRTLRSIKEHTSCRRSTGHRHDRYFIWYGIKCCPCACCIRNNPKDAHLQA